MEKLVKGSAQRFCPECGDRHQVSRISCPACGHVYRENNVPIMHKRIPWIDANNIAGARSLASANAVKLTDNAPFARGSTLHAAYMIALAESILKEIRK